MGKAEPKFDTKTTSHGGEIRKHYFLDRYVIIAPRRGKRPHAFTEAENHKSEVIGVSPSIEKELSVLNVNNDEGQWQVKVINNAFPALSLENLHAFGKQEIVIETPHHNTEFSELSLEQIERIFQSYIARVKSLCQIEGIAYVAVFKNDGPRAGATLAHAHSQIVALPLVPPVVEAEAIAFEEYYIKHGTCPVCDIWAWEKQQKERVIFEDEHILAICPYAGSAPYGVWIIPKKHHADFGSLNFTERTSVAQALRLVTRQLDKYGISFNYFLQDSPRNQEHHFVLKIEPRPNVWGGLELSTGVVINPVPPELAADWYKKSA